MQACVTVNCSKSITFGEALASVLEAFNPKEAAARPPVVDGGYVVVRGEVAEDARKYFTANKVYKVQATVWHEPSGEACIRVVCDALVPLHILVNSYSCAFLGSKAIAVPCDIEGN